tara:strand:+ start:129 stop:278 length:150 start_codon:yes stop_codon:yes gene_type:complete
MNQEWLGTIYCLLACVGFSVVYLSIWNLIHRVETYIDNIKIEKRKGKWK